MSTEKMLIEPAQEQGKHTWSPWRKYCKNIANMLEIEKIKCVVLSLCGIFMLSTTDANGAFVLDEKSIHSF